MSDGFQEIYDILNKDDALFYAWNEQEIRIADNVDKLLAEINYMGLDGDKPFDLECSADIIEALDLLKQRYSGKGFDMIRIN